MHQPSDVPSAYRPRHSAAVRVGGQAAGAHGRASHRRVDASAKPASAAGHPQGSGPASDMQWRAPTGRPTAPSRGRCRRCHGVPTTSRRGAGCMALAHEPACGGFPECLYSGAVVSVSVGDRTLVPGAHARLSDRAVTRADGSAVAERDGTLSYGGLADPQDHHGWSRLSPWAWRRGV